MEWKEALPLLQENHTAQTDAPAKLLIEKGVITEAEFLAKIAEERATRKLIAFRLNGKSRAVTDPVEQLERSEAMERLEHSR
jgi:hypothetical protein